MNGEGGKIRAEKAIEEERRQKEQAQEDAQEAHRRREQMEQQLKDALAELERVKTGQHTSALLSLSPSNIISSKAQQ